MPRSLFELGLLLFLLAGSLFPLRASPHRSSYHLRNSTAMAALFVLGLECLGLLASATLVAIVVLLAAAHAPDSWRLRRSLFGNLRPAQAISRLLLDTVFVATATIVSWALYRTLGSGAFPIPLARVSDLLAFLATNTCAPTVVAVCNEVYYRFFAEPVPERRTPPRELAFLPGSAPLYRVMLVFGAPLQILAHVLYLSYGPVALLIALGWFVLGILLHAAFLRDRVRLHQAFRELEASQRILVQGEVTGRIVHQTRHQLGLIGIGTHLIREALKETPVDRVKVFAQIDRLDGVAAALKQMLSDDLGTRRFEDSGEERPASASLTRAVTLRDLVQEELERLQGKAEQLGVRLTLEADTAERGLVPRDPVAAEQLGQGLFNVAENALAAARSRVCVRLREASELLSISVTDDGPGMPPELLARAAEPFVTTKTDGSGMGLFIASTAARRCGGELVLENLGGGGFRATFRLPGPGTTPALRA